MTRTQDCESCPLWRIIQSHAKSPAFAIFAGWILPWWIRGQNNTGIYSLSLFPLSYPAATSASLKITHDGRSDRQTDTASSSLFLHTPSPPSTSSLDMDASTESMRGKLYEQSFRSLDGVKTSFQVHTQQSREPTNQQTNSPTI